MLGVEARAVHVDDGTVPTLAVDSAPSTVLGAREARRGGPERPTVAGPVEVSCS
jgi:hypothetical protein